MSQSLAHIRAIVFDLEDILFDRADWLLPAVEHAAQLANHDGQRALGLATDYIKQRGSADAGLYNHILLGLGQSDSVLNIKAFIDRINSYRATPGSLNLLPGIKDALQELRKYYKIGIVSVGVHEIQRNKVAVLGLSELVNDVTIEEDKPGLRRVPVLHRALQASVSRLSERAGFTLFVADNPFKDFQAARRLGMMSVRVLTGEYSEVEYPSLDHTADYDISSVARVPELMKLQPEARTRVMSAEEVDGSVMSILDSIKDHKHSLSIGN